MSAIDFPLFLVQYNPARGGTQKNQLQHLRESLPGWYEILRICLMIMVRVVPKTPINYIYWINSLALFRRLLQLFHFSFRQDTKSWKENDKDLSTDSNNLFKRWDLEYLCQSDLSTSQSKTTTSLIMNFFEQRKDNSDMSYWGSFWISLRLVKQFGTAKNSNALTTISARHPFH